MRLRWYFSLVSAAVLTTSALVFAGPALAVSIASFAPISGLAANDPYCPGGHVTITGAGFVGDGGVPTVSFNGVKAVDVQVGSDTTLYVMVPKGATTGPITVTTPQGTATTASLSATQTTTPIGELKLPSNVFTVLQCWGQSAASATEGATSSATRASVSKFAPVKGKAGATITITGTGLTGATAVKVGGVSATFKVVSGTKITATVPAKAKIGKITVTTPAGTATSATLFTKL